MISFFTAGSLVGAVVGSFAALAGGWALMRPSGRSLVGQKCVACKEGIYREADADLCAKCGAAYHARCEKTHAATHA